MPIYEYECRDCNKIYEIIHRHDSQTKIVCEQCLNPVERLMSLGGFRLKGAGWTSKLNLPPPEGE